MENEKPIEIIEFTDPVCTWCWGSEPLLSALKARYKDQIEVRFVMGGLVKDIRDFNDGSIGGNPEESNRAVASHWEEASSRHGMPVDAKNFHLFSEEYPSTYPQNIAYKAAQFESEELANRFLRRMREASIAEGLLTSRKEVLIQLASEVGLDVEKFITHLEDGSAKAGFDEDLYTTANHGVGGFPTFLLRVMGKPVLLRGYREYSMIRSIINTLSNGSIKEVPLAKTEGNVIDFINENRRVTPKEIEVAFDFTKQELEEMLNSLLTKKLLKKIEAGNGYYLETAAKVGYCDPITGICQI